MFANSQYRGLCHLELYCTLIIEAWLKINMSSDSRYLELSNACIYRSVQMLETDLNFNILQLFFCVYLECSYWKVFSVYHNLIHVAFKEQLYLGQHCSYSYMDTYISVLFMSIQMNKQRA